MQIPSEKELFKAGVHFGHRPSSWHPKMANFIFGQKNNVHIIDLTKTRLELEKALGFLKTTAASGGQILFVGTKVQAREMVKKYAEQVGMPYVHEKWLGGTLTNFKVIRQLVSKMENLERQATEEDYEKKYTKKERHDFEMEIEKLKQMVGGIQRMNQLPAAVFIASVRNEKTVVSEANNKKIPTVAICDTNANPEKVTYPIPANDDALKSLEIIIGLAAEAIKEGCSSAAAKK